MELNNQIDGSREFKAPKSLAFRDLLPMVGLALSWVLKGGNSRCLFGGSLKSKLEGYEGQERLPSCSPCVQLARINQGNKLEEKLAKSLKESTLPLIVALPYHHRVLHLCLVSLLKSVEATKSLIEVLHQGGLIISMDGHLPTQSHQEGTSDPTRMNLNETLRSILQSIEGLTRQFQSVARDVKELKKDKSSATMEQRVGDKLGGFNSPHHKRSFDNVSSYGYHDMLVQNSHPFHEGGYRGRPQMRGERRRGLGGR
ncbi:hypothetical protein M9H77_30382 [Catharanthus roseus]|uniref:Uncharacterized protein n=1 Tax=Catharanthus roseus TaxID=4058 RepID=A0ACB9ZYY9_CATRO|nr:hypothetical protein M9H77_30382 [Catharanthus roseus]